MTIFITIAIFLFVQEPYYTELAKNNVGIANIHMENVKDLEINNQKITRITTAKDSIKYKDKDVLNEVHVLSFEKDFVYDVKSKKATYQDSILTLQKDVVVTRDDNTTFLSDKISYDKVKKLLYTDTSFEVKNPIYNVKGEGFTYDLDKKSIIASKVYADYKLEKK